MKYERRRLLPKRKLLQRPLKLCLCSFSNAFETLISLYLIAKLFYFFYCENFSPIFPQYIDKVVLEKRRKQNFEKNEDGLT